MSAPQPDDRPPTATCPHCHLPLVEAAVTVSAEGAAPVYAGTQSVLGPEAAATGVAGTPPPERVGRFEVRRFVGEGAFGRVYEAYDPALRRVVALKVAKAEHMAGPRRVERFLREARAAAGLTHPNVVAVYDSGQDGASYYIASQFVAGRTLADELEARGGKGLDLREAAALVRKLAEALAYAHRMGVVHRDVKPANVMLDERGEPLLMDFGLAARADEAERLTVAGQFMGTPEYTAPEQWGGKATAASDQYSLGCVLYELLTGRPPFGGGSVEHYLMLHTQMAPPSPRLVRREVPRDLETIALKCLEKEEGRRYAGCGALADDLRRWQEGEAVTARRAGVAERLWRWARRNPAVAGLTAAVVLAFVLGIAVSTAFGIQAGLEASRADERADEADRERDAARAAEGRAKEAAVKEGLARQDALKQAERADSLSHALLLDKAVRALVDHRDEAMARELLSRCPPGMEKTWEHRHVLGLYGQFVPLTLKAHTFAVTAVAYSPDGTRIALGSNGKTVRVWDAQTGRELLRLEHAGRVAQLAYSPDGTRLASCATLYQTQNVRGEANRVLDFGLRVWAEVRVWDARTGKGLLTLTGHADRVTSVAYSPDGKRIASGSLDGTLKVWDAATGQEELTLRGHTARVNDVAYSPDGKRIASANADGTLKVWDAATGQEKLTLRGHTGSVIGLAYTRDGTRIASASADGTVKIWEAPAPKAP